MATFIAARSFKARLRLGRDERHGAAFAHLAADAA